jgi:hypothetical protein
VLQNNTTGIDISNKNIIIQCTLSSGSKRCILDGSGLSRIFYGSNVNISFDKINFSNGSAAADDNDGRGGALMISDSTVHLQQCAFFRNKAVDGGAISIRNSDFFIEESRTASLGTVFVANEAMTSGGALDMQDLLVSDIKNTVFQGNIASFSVS